MLRTPPNIIPGAPGAIPTADTRLATGREAPPFFGPKPRSEFPSPGRTRRDPSTRQPPRAPPAPPPMPCARSCPPVSWLPPDGQHPLSPGSKPCPLPPCEIRTCPPATTRWRAPAVPAPGRSSAPPFPPWDRESESSRIQPARGSPRQCGGWQCRAYPRRERFPRAERPGPLSARPRIKPPPARPVLATRTPAPAGVRAESGPRSLLYPNEPGRPAWTANSARRRRNRARGSACRSSLPPPAAVGEFRSPAPCPPPAPPPPALSAWHWRFRARPLSLAT